MFYFGVHVSEFAVDHDDAEVALVVGEGVLVGDDVDVPEFLEDLELVLDVLPFLLVDLKGLDLLECVVVVLVGPVLAEEDVPRGSRSEPAYPVPISFPISYSYIAVRYSIILYQTPTDCKLIEIQLPLVVHLLLCHCLLLSLKPSNQQRKVK